MTGRAWTAADDVTLIDRYPREPTSDVARDLGRTDRAVYMRAALHGLRKTEGYLASPSSGRTRHGDTRGLSARFKPEHTTWNRGVKGSTGNHPNCRKSQFRKGERKGAAAHNYRPIGSELIDKDGTLLRKVSETGNRRRDWRPVHVLTWEDMRGPIPQGHIVVFRQGMKTTNAELITANRLEVITRAENMRRNSYLTRYPKEVADVIRLRGALNRKINNRSKKA